jgi:hypothetical protein
MQIDISYVKLAFLWGPAVLILIGLYKLTIKFGNIFTPFIERFITAQQSQATALTDQAAATRALNESFKDFTSRDNNEHREMLIILKMIAQNMQSFEDVKKKHNEIHGTEGAHCGGPKSEG